MLFLYPATDFICAGLCVVLSGVVLGAHPRRLANVAYASAMAATGSAMFGLGMVEVSRAQGEDALPWFRWTYASLSLLGPPWLLFAMVFSRENWKETIWKLSPLVAGAFAAGLFFSIGAAFLDLVERGKESIILAPSIHMYLTVISVAILASIERTFRSARENQRWRIKHLLLGMFVIFGFFTFYSAQVLIDRHFSLDLLRLSSIVVLLGTACMAISVYRDRSLTISFKVSHHLAYRSIALVASGVYLILMALGGRLLGRLTDSPYLEGLVLFAAIVALPLVFLSETFRMRARRWVQRHFFRSRYDYREQWLRSVENLLGESRIEDTGQKLNDLIADEVSVQEVSTWLRREHDGRQELSLLASSGLPDLPPLVESGVLIESLERSPDPFFIGEAFRADREVALAAAAGEDLFRITRAAICAPLLSGKHLVGVLTVGLRTSLTPLDREDLEFLKVICGQAASQLHNAQLLQRLVQAKEAEAFRTLSTFLIHDLKNFTSTLNLIAQNASHHSDNPQFLQDAFSSVTRIAQTMNRLCGSLRTLAGGIRLNRRLGDLNGLVTSAVEQFAAKGKGRVVRNLGSLPPMEFDGEQMKNVLANLLLNAQEAVGPEGTIEVSTQPRDGWVTIEVRDDGRGIPRDFLEKELFVPFHTTKSGGTGIGLFQSKTIAEAHGGRIEVESEEGRGTTVRVHLPSRQEASSGKPNQFLPISMA